MCSFWLLKKAPSNVTQIELIFPQTGHSYIPPDRVFGLIEKSVRKLESIVLPDDYEKIYQNIGKTFMHGTEVPIHDFKQSADQTFKTKWHFQIKSCVKVFITENDEILFRGERNYKNEDGHSASILKRGKQISDIKINSPLPTGIPLKGNKIADINTLLTKHYGQNWRDDSKLIYYNTLLRDNNINVEVPDYNETYNIDGDPTEEEILTKV